MINIVSYEDNVNVEYKRSGPYIWGTYIRGVGLIFEMWRALVYVVGLYWGGGGHIFGGAIFGMR